MKVKRIVANIETQDTSKAKHFYEKILGLDQLMDLGFIATCGSNEKWLLKSVFYLKEDLAHQYLICQLKLIT